MTDRQDKDIHGVEAWVERGRTIERQLKAGRAMLKALKQICMPGVYTTAADLQAGRDAIKQAEKVGITAGEE